MHRHHQQFQKPSRQILLLQNIKHHSWKHCSLSLFPPRASHLLPRIIITTIEHSKHPQKKLLSSSPQNRPNQNQKELCNKPVHANNIKKRKRHNEAETHKCENPEPRSQFMKRNPWLNPEKWIILPHTTPIHSISYRSPGYPKQTTNFLQKRRGEEKMKDWGNARWSIHECKRHDACVCKCDIAYYLPDLRMSMR